MKTVFRTDDILNQRIWREIIQEYSANRMIINGGNSTRFIHPPTLNNYEKNVYSQCGEDGVLEEIFARIGTRNKICVEFGGADGYFCSNTRNLIDHKGWKGYMFEPGTSKPDLSLYDEYITAENINDVFTKYDLPRDPDFLSIDIDGMDFWVWQALSGFKPQVVTIETNPALPNVIPLSVPYRADFNFKADIKNGGYFGCNLRAACRLGRKKGYQFATICGWNPIFVREEEFSKLNLPKLSEDRIIADYFLPEGYWFKKRDKLNREWVDPFE